MFVGDGLDCLEDFGPDSQHRNQQLGTPRLMRRLIGHMAQKNQSGRYICLVVLNQIPITDYFFHQNWLVLSLARHVAHERIGKSAHSLRCAKLDPTPRDPMPDNTCSIPLKYSQN